jgi:hypothetical protein
VTKRRLIAFLLGIALSVASLSPAYAEDLRVIDVASVTWVGAKASDVTVSQVESAIRNEVGARWKRYTTIEGASVDKSITFTLGQTLVAPIGLIRPMQCEGSAASDFMNSIRAETYKRLGISDYSKRYLVILAPEAGCIWSGRALISNISKGGGS